MSAQLLLRRLLEQPHLSGGEDLMLVLSAGSELAESEPETTHTVKTSQGSFRVCRASTELELRHQLWRAGDDPVVAFVADELAKTMPADLLLAARNQQVQVLTTNEVLAAALGVEVTGTIHPALEQLALDRLDDLRRLAERTFPSAVDADLLGELLLEVCGEARVLRRSAGELLAEWIEETPSWSPTLRDLVREKLPARFGAEGEVLRWALSAGPDACHDVVIHGALLSVTSAVPAAAWGPFRTAVDEDALKVDREVLREVLKDLASSALEGLKRSTAAPLLDRASALGRQVLVSGALQTSKLLPLAFQDRVTDLARRAAAGEVLWPSQVDALTAYRSATRAETGVIESMARLTRWLAEDSATEDDVLRQVRHYQRHGAFADLAARQLQRRLTGTRHFQAEGRRLLERYRDQRDAENRHFAQCLAPGYESALHTQGMVPLHRVMKSQRDKIDAEPTYLVVLDGCSYPVFLEILSTLSQDEDYPLGLIPSEEVILSGLPALAPLPTITSHARGALFLGRVPKDPLIAETRFRGIDEPTADKARLAENRHVGAAARILFLKGDLTDGGQQLFRTLRERRHGLVAAVFNAVDDQIGSANTGAQVRIDPGDVAAFKGSLKEASENGYQLLLAADHGHTPFVDKSLRRGGASSRSGSRWLELEPGDEVPEGFLEIDLAGLGGFSAAVRVAFAWRMGVYRGKQQAGFHGGCGLEEMVVPLAWLMKDGQRADEPSWWAGVRTAVAERPPADEELATLRSEAVAEPAAPEPEAPRAQMELFRPPDHGLPAELLERLTVDERSVLDLLRQNGSARVSELALHVNKPVGRLQGMMSRLDRRLGGHKRFTREVLPDGEGFFRYRDS